MQTYAHYVSVMTEQGITPVTEEEFNRSSYYLPRVADVQMSHSLNYAIGVALEAGDIGTADSLIAKCDEHDGECWGMYKTEGDYFPAGGLWFNFQDWTKQARLDARPLHVAHMLDYAGSLPEDIVKVEVNGVRYYFEEGEIIGWDEELGWDFIAHCKLENPTPEQLADVIKSIVGITA